jgi:chromosomal replication initiation ATPase DnaA
MLTELARQHNEHLARKQRLAQAAARANPKTDSEFSAALNEIEEPKKKEPWFYDPKASSVISETQAAISITDVQRAACRHFGISRQDLRKVRRLHAVVRPRQIAMYLCLKLTVRSSPEIGRMFGGYDHTTVLHAGCVIEKLIKSDWRIAYDVAHIERLLG